MRSSTFCAACWETPFGAWCSLSASVYGCRALSPTVRMACTRAPLLLQPNEEDHRVSEDSSGLRWLRLQPQGIRRCHGHSEQISIRGARNCGCTSAGVPRERGNGSGAQECPQTLPKTVRHSAERGDAPGPQSTSQYRYSASGRINHARSRRSHDRSNHPWTPWPRYVRALAARVYIPRGDCLRASRGYGRALSPDQAGWPVWNVADRLPVSSIAEIRP